VHFTYDAQGRRTSKAVYAWNGVYFPDTPTSVTLYVYDGTNLIGEVDASTGKLTKSYTWDPSKAGGVGGLLAITTYDGSGTVNGVYLPVYNGHGDVVALVNKANGAIVATYVYKAFGEVTVTGDASINPFLWQTEYYDADAKLYLFEKRAYTPVMGRFAWPAAANAAVRSQTG
jgi:RHS repeat-associated protein